MEQDKQHQDSWHSQTTDAVLTRLESTESGLSDKESNKRLSKFGLNEVETHKTRHPLYFLVAQFDNLLIYVLMISALITLMLGQFIDSSVIFAVVIINAVIGFIQEYKAEKSLTAIAQLIAKTSIVYRNGKKQQIPCHQIVPGDIVLLKPGDKIPADIRLITIQQLQIQESILTGESEAVSKTMAAVGHKTILAERQCMAFAGTMVVYGTATGVVVATGKNTELSRIASMLADPIDFKTPLLVKMAEFTRMLTITILLLACFIFAFGTLIYHHSLTTMFMAAVGLAVAAIPEGLPAVITIILSIGVMRMTRCHAIIRRLPAVETLGAVSTICTDKTGTLTCNEMMVQQVMTAEGCFTISGNGYKPQGEINKVNEVINLNDYPILQQAIIAGLLCNDGELSKDEQGHWQIIGNPTDGALLVLAKKSALNLQTLKKDWPICASLPFDTRHKLMATLHKNNSGEKIIYVKGAADYIIKQCTKVYGVNNKAEAINQNEWQKQLISLATQGQRVIAVACLYPIDNHCDTINLADINESCELTLIALLGIIDPPRPEVIDTIKECRQAGIDIKMITGDHQQTAIAIGKQIGITGTALTGADIDQLNDEELIDAAVACHIFARTIPEHKYRLVKALQAKQQIVAMTGDGINDAPALRAADIGIAMGEKGTEAAKEVSEMVLTDDNFITIAKAVRQGRVVYQNLTKAILFMLPTNGAEAFAVMLAILLNQTLPITAIQILWVNMVTSVSLGIALAFEKAESEVMSEAPRAKQQPILSNFLIWRTVFVSLALVIGIYGLFWLAQALGYSLANARSTAINALVIGEIAYLLNSRKIYHSVLNWRYLFNNSVINLSIIAVILLQLIFTYTPIMQRIFHISGLSWVTWLILIVFGVTIFLIFEFEKYIVRCYRRSY